MMQDKEKQNKKEKKPFNVKLFYRRTCLIIYDIISIVFASYMAVLIRYEFHLDMIPEHFLSPVNRFLPINIFLTLCIFYFFRMYHSLWAFAGGDGAAEPCDVLRDVRPDEQHWAAVF